MITISPTSPVPLYDQISRQIKEAILRGELAPGQGLPSIRQLAQELGTSVITVKRAYQELEREGLLLTRQGLGCFVAPVKGEELASNRAEAVARHLRLAAEEAAKVGLTPEEVRELLEHVLGGNGR